MNQLNCYWEINFLHLSEIWGKMELPGGFYFGIVHPGWLKIL